MSDRKLNVSYKISGTSNGKTLDLPNRGKGTGNVEYKIDKNLKLKAAFTEEVLTKGPSAPGSKITLSKVGEWNLSYDLSKKDSPMSGDYTAKTKLDGKDLTLKAAWQQKNNAVNLTATYAFDKDNKLEARYGVQSQDVGITATHRTTSGYTLAYDYAHPSEAWSASIAKSAKSVAYKATYNNQNVGELKIAKAPLTLVLKTPMTNTPKCDITATFDKSFTF